MAKNKKSAAAVKKLVGKALAAAKSEGWGPADTEMTIAFTPSGEAGGAVLTTTLIHRKTRAARMLGLSWFELKEMTVSRGSDLSRAIIDDFEKLPAVQEQGRTIKAETRLRRTGRRPRAA